MRKDDARSIDHGLRPAACGRDPLRGSPARPQASRVPAPRADGLSGPHRRAESPADDLRVGRRGRADPQDLGGRGRAGRPGALPSRPSPARAILPVVPARAVGRPAAARGHRRRARTRTPSDRRRRAGLQPRRVGPRRDPPAPAQTPKGVADQRAHRHARPGPRVDGRRSRRRDVSRKDRRGGTHQGRAYAAPAPVHARAPRRRPGARRSRSTVPGRRAAGSHEDPHWVPVPSAMPGDCERTSARRGIEDRCRGEDLGLEELRERHLAACHLATAEGGTARTATQPAASTAAAPSTTTQPGSGPERPAP